MSKSAYKLIPQSTLQKLSEETKEGYKKSFDKLDINGDGELDVNELSQLLSAYDINADLAVVAVLICDTDNSGTITFDEYINFVNLLEDLEQDPTIIYRNVFNMFDDDNSGTLEDDEVKKFIGYFFSDSIPEDKYRKFFDIIDSDGDGKLNFDEICQFLDAVTKK